jgi:hypothetical protein
MLMITSSPAPILAGNHQARLTATTPYARRRRHPGTVLPLGGAVAPGRPSVRTRANSGEPTADSMVGYLLVDSAGERNRSRAWHSPWLRQRCAHLAHVPSEARRLGPTMPGFGQRARPFCTEHLGKHWGDSGGTLAVKDKEIRVRMGKFTKQPKLGHGATTSAFARRYV